MPKVNLNACKNPCSNAVMLRPNCPREFITHFPKATTLDLNPCTQADTTLCAVSSVLSDRGLVSGSEEEKAAGW